ncbi:nucleotide sugar dehydrogenase [Kiloniella sp. EL199]|uniref:nucleotide sugar dehydrogenase n=1 Tax=Kiloniella sp. EL199 TaxID=2107581 RepID=UPI000EA13508|nr:nucleotide sugar dehydrogenase [Kiloniella sp. EL199]
MKADISEVRQKQELRSVTINQYNDRELELVPERMGISIIGLGYVGLVSAACLSSCGHNVIGLDKDQSKLNDLRRGISPIVEEMLPELLEQGVHDKTISATDDVTEAIANTDMTFVCVGTPSTETGHCDLTALRSVAVDLGKALKEKSKYHLIVIRSTIPPGTTRNELLPILERYSELECGKDFGLCFHPEFLRESSAVKDFYSPPKTVCGGYDERSSVILAKLYDNIDDKVIYTSIEAAETVKYVDNTWHALKVSFANEIGKICKAADIDSHEVMDIFIQDTKLNLSSYYLKPGFAYGGSCLPKDVRGINHLARSLGVTTPILAAIDHSNRSQIEHAMDMIEATGGKKLGFLGLTFKPGTDDLRESPILPVISMLMSKGYQVRIYDSNLDVDRCVAHYKQHAKAANSWETQCLEHLDEIVCTTLAEIKSYSDTLIICHDTPEFRDETVERRDDQEVVDLVRTFGSITHKDKIFTVGMDDYIQKPLTQSSLIEKIPPTDDKQKPMRVLVADDNPANARIAQVMLEKIGHKAVTVLDGNEAMRKHLTNNFDLILMDLNMPELDGLGATKLIRNLPGDKRDVPIIALTSHAAPEESTTYRGLCW